MKQPRLTADQRAALRASLMYAAERASEYERGERYAAAFGSLIGLAADYGTVVNLSHELRALMHPEDQEREETGAEANERLADEAMDAWEWAEEQKAEEARDR